MARLELARFFVARRFVPVFAFAVRGAGLRPARFGAAFERVAVLRDVVALRAGMRFGSFVRFVESCGLAACSRTLSLDGMPTPVRTARPGPTDDDLAFVRALLEGPHDELELAMMVVTYRDRLLAPFRTLARDWQRSTARELVAPAVLVAQAVDRATGVSPCVLS